MTLRFGMFIPQGWRMDLVGHRPGRAVAARCPRLARRADGGPVGIDLGLRPLPHHADADGRGDARGVDPDGRVCGEHEPGPARPDVHLHRATATRPTWPRWPRRSTSCPAAGVEMGIGGGWYEHEWRAYGYGFPPARERLRALDEGVEIMRQAWTTGSATLARPDLPGRRRDRPAAAAAGRRDPVLDRRRRREGHPADRGEVRAVHQLRRHAGGFRAQVARCWPATVADLGRDFDSDHPVRQLQRRDRRDRAGGAGPAGSVARQADSARRSRPRGAGTASFVGMPASARWSRWSRTSPSCAAGTRVRDLLLPRHRLRHLGSRPVREAGDPGAAVAPVAPRSPGLARINFLRRG